MLVLGSQGICGENWLIRPGNFNAFGHKVNPVRYCWCTKSCTTKDDDCPIIYWIYWVSTIPSGAGFLPSMVWWDIPTLKRWHLKGSRQCHIQTRWELTGSDTSHGTADWTQLTIVVTGRIFQMHYLRNLSRVQQCNLSGSFETKPFHHI